MADSNDNVTCDFCGKDISKSEASDANPVLRSDVRGTGHPVTICKSCIHTGMELLCPDVTFRKLESFSDIHAKDCKKTRKIIPPREIFNELKKFVIGQDLYLVDLSVYGYNLMRRMQMASEGVPTEKIPPKKNLWVIGSSGSGKTFSINILSKILDIPMCIYDVTGITENGYTGEDVSDILAAYIRSVGDIQKAEKGGIIILDEIDKIRCEHTQFKDVSGRGVQEGILHIVEPNGISKVNVPMGEGFRKYSDKSTLCIDNIGFIALGAFSDIGEQLKNANPKCIGFRAQSFYDTEDIAYSIPNNVELNDILIKHGFLPEIISRFPMKSVLKPLSKHDLKRILIESENSPLKQEIEKYRIEGIELQVTNEAVDAIVEEARKMRINARGLGSKLSEVLRSYEFENFGTDNGNKIVVIDLNACGKLVVRTQKCALSHV